MKIANKRLACFYMLELFLFILCFLRRVYYFGVFAGGYVSLARRCRRWSKANPVVIRPMPLPLAKFDYIIRWGLLDYCRLPTFFYSVCVWSDYRPLQEDPRPQCPTLISHPPAKRPAVSQQNPLLSEPFACGRIGSLDRLDLLFRWAAGATARGYVHSFDYSFVPDTKRKDVPIFGNALRRTWLSQQPSQTEAEAGRGLPATSTNVRNMWLRRFQISPVSPRGKPSPTVDRGRQSQKFSTEWQLKGKISTSPKENLHVVNSLE